MPHALHCRMFHPENERKMRAMNKMTVAAVALAALTTFPSVLKAGGNQETEAAAPRQEARIEISADRPEAVYRLGEKAVFTVKVPDLSFDVPDTVSVWWKLNNFGDKVFASGTEKLPSGGGTFTVEGAQTEPGFLRLDVAVKEKKSVSARWGVAFDPDKIEPGTPYPGDFMDFWREAIRKYDKEVTEPIRATEVKRNKSAVMYELRIPSTQGRSVWGYFSEPIDKTKGPFPLNVCVPGAGPSSWGCSMSEDAMYLKVNVHYYDPSALKGEKHKSPKCLKVQKEEDEAYAKKYPVKTVRYCNCGIASSREDYFYYGVILAVNRSVDWAAARPDVDRRRVRYSSDSQGGGFGLILAALNKNIRLARIGVPAITDLLGDRVSAREAGWPRLIDAQLPENREAAAKNAPYFCGVNFARHIDIPVGFVVGFVDVVCPPHAGYAAYNVCPSGKKAIFNAVGWGHDAHRSDAGAALERWIAEQDKSVGGQPSEIPEAAERR